MSKSDAEIEAKRNIQSFTLFRVFFSARFYYPVYALLFLNYGLSLEQFGVLNAIWAATIVLLEVPSGALADTVGRRVLLISAGVFMILEMAVLLIAPVGGGVLLFALFAFNRILSGAAEAAASGADEALVYDSMKRAGREGDWGHVLERVQRDTSLAFFFAMMIGAAVYDAEMVNAVFTFLGIAMRVEQSSLVKIPILLTFFSSLVVFLMALRMKEVPVERSASVMETVKHSFRQSMVASKWIWTTAAPFGVVLAAMVVDSIVRQFLTLASQYWNVINLPIASYGLIGSGMALIGVFTPRIARYLTEKRSPFQNFTLTSLIVVVGLFGLGFAVPWWGIVPAIFLYASMHLAGFFVSRYLNAVAPSGQRATILSFRGLSTNFTYGLVSILYSVLITGLKSDEASVDSSDAVTYQKYIFTESLGWFPWYFLFSFILVLLIYRLRFGSKSIEIASFKDSEQ